MGMDVDSIGRLAKYLEFEREDYKKNSYISFRLSAETQKKLYKLCSNRGLSVSVVLRKLVADYIGEDQ